VKMYMADLEKKNIDMARLRMENEQIQQKLDRQELRKVKCKAKLLLDTRMLSAKPHLRLLRMTTSRTQDSWHCSNLNCQTPSKDWSWL